MKNLIALISALLFALVFTLAFMFIMNAYSIELAMFATLILPLFAFMAYMVYLETKTNNA